MKTILKKTMFGIALMLAGIAGAAAPGMQVTFSSTGPDAYPDGTAVVDGEYYALAWAEDTAKLVMGTDGTVAEGRVLARVAVAEGHRCPPVNVKLDDETANACKDGVWGVFLLDTRGHGEGDSSIESATRIANATVEIASNGFLSYKKFGPRLGVPGITEGVTDNPVAAIGNTGYASLADAIAAVPTDGTEKTVVMLAGETIASDAGITIVAGKNIVLDLNGQTVQMAVASADERWLIKNEGTLTVKDSDENGKILMNATGQASTSIRKSAIKNMGALIVEGGIIELTYTGTNKEEPTAILNDASERATSITVNGGTVVNSSNRGMGVFLAVNDTYATTFTVQSGKVEGYGAAVRYYFDDRTLTDAKLTFGMSGGELYGRGMYAVQGMTISSTDWNSISFDISGGTIGCAGLLGRKHVMSPLQGTVSISGGTFNGDVYIYGHDLEITGGDFAGNVTLHRTKESLTAASISGGQFSSGLTIAETTSESTTNPYYNAKFITGGIYGVAPEVRNVVDEYVVVDNTDSGTQDDYPKAIGGAVASVTSAGGTTYYATLSDAITAANAADVAEITILDSSITTSPDADWNVVGNKLVKKFDVAQIVTNGGATTNKYETLAEAFAAANAAGTATITMLEDINVTNVACVVSSGNAITLDLNGKIVQGTDNTSGSFAFITNNGTFTIDDTSENHDGELVYSTLTPDMSSVPGYGNYTIENEGTLNIVSGTVRQTTRGPACYALNNSSQASNAVFNMQGGLMTSPGNVVRAYGLSDTYENEVNISGGSIAATGAAALWVQLGSPAPKVTLNVTGGSMSGNMYAFFDVTDGNSLINTSYNIQGGTFTGEIFTYGATTEISGGTFNGYVTEKAGNLTISGGTFNDTVEVYGGGTARISGGTFSERVPEEYCADNYIPTDADPVTGLYTVKRSSYVAQIVSADGTVTNKYESLADAIAAVPTDGTETTITMIADEAIDVTGYALTIAAGKNVVLDLNGHEVVGQCTTSATSALIRNLGTLTIMDSTDTAANGTGGGKLIGGADPTWTWDGSNDYSGSYASNLILNEGTLTVNSGLLQNVSSGSAAYAIDNRNAGKVTINGGRVDAAKASAVRMFYNNGGKVTVTGGTIGHYTDENDCSFMGVQVQAGTDADVEITGGTFAATYAVYSRGTGDSSVTISDGTFNGQVIFDSTGPDYISITGGTFLNEVEAYGSQSGFISGGIFANDVDERYCAEGYISAVYDAESGRYIVRNGTYVAQILGDGYVAISASIAEPSADVYLDMWRFWNMQGMVDANGNECPQYVSTTDETLYRDLSVGEGAAEDWVSAKYLFDNHLASGKDYNAYQTYVLYEEGQVALNKYETLGEAINAALDGNIVQLLTNIVDVADTYVINKSITLDGAGYSITAAPVPADGHRNMFSLWGGGTAMFKVETGAVTFKNVTLDGDVTHRFTFLISADNSSIALTTENVRLIHGGEISVDSNSATITPGNGYGAAIHLNNGAHLIVSNGFYACTGTNVNGVTTGIFPFTAILPENLDAGTSVAFELTGDPNDPANVDIGEDLLLVGMEGDLIDTYGLDGVQGMLDFMKVPSRFIPYTLTLGDGSTYAFTGASPRTWNEIIDYGKDIMDVATSNGFGELDKDTTPVEVGLAIDTVIPDVFTFSDTNLTVNGNGKALSGEIKYTDNAGLIENIVLGTEDNALVLDLTEVTQPIEIGSGIAVTNVTMKMTADQATAGTPVIIWDVEGGVDAPENEAGVSVAIVDEQGDPTGDTAELIWDDELGLAYIGPCEARLTGPTHPEPIYTTLANAIAWAEQSGDTVTLMMDITNVTGTVQIDKSLILDGAGHSITAATNSEPRDVVSAYSGARVMLQIGGDNVVVTNITLNGGMSHYYTYLIEAKHGTLTVADVELLHGGEADVSGEKGVGYGAGIHVNGAVLLVEGNFVADTGGETDGVFPFTGILYDGGDVAFANGVTADIGDDLLLVGMGPLNVDDFMANMDIDAILAGMNVPNGFIPYTLALNGTDSGMGFVGASPRKWNDIIDYGKEIMDVADTIGYSGMDKDTTPVEVGLLTDTVLPDTFTFADTNFTVNGNGNALAGTIKYTDNAGLIHDIVLGTEGNELVLDMTETTKPVVLGSGIAVSNVTVQMTAEQATAGTPVIIWDAEGGVDAPANEAGVIVQIVDDQGDPTGNTKGLIWDDELGVAYIGPCEARLTGPTHDKPIYTTLADAIARAEQTGDTVTLLMNVTNVTATYEIAKQDLVINGGSNMVSAAAVTEHRNLFESWGGSKNMFKLQSGNITFRNITLDGDATHAYTFLISADNSGVALTTENVRLLHGGEQSVDADGVTLTPGNGYGAAIHLNNGASLTVKDGFYACTGTNENGVTTGVFPFTAILPENLDAGTTVTFDLTEDTDANPTVDISDDLLLVGMEGDLIDDYGIDVVQGMLNYMKVPSRFIPYTLTLDNGSSYAFTGVSPCRWNEIINYGKDIMDVSTAMGFDGLDKNTTPVEVGLVTDTVLPAGVAGDGYDFLYEDSNFSINGNGNALSGTIKFTDDADGGMLRDIELGRDGAPLTLDLSATTNAVILGGEVVISNVVIKLTEDQATVGKIVFEWDATDETPDDEQGVEVTVVNGSGEPTGEKKGLVWDEEYGIAYIGPVEARLTGPTHDMPVYTTLSNAIERAASSGDTVSLMTNVTLAACQTIDKSIVFNLNGKVLAAADDAIRIDSSASVQMYSEGTVTGNIYVASGTLTITNGVYVGSLGKTSGDGAQIAVSGGHFLEPVLQDHCADGYMPVTTAAPEYAATPYTVARIKIVYPTGPTAGGEDTVGIPMPIAWVIANTGLIETNANGEVVVDNLNVEDVITGLGQNGANGTPLWQSYVLGLDPNDVTSQLRLEGLPATADGMVTIRGLNINVPAILESQGTTVGFHLEEAAPGTPTDSDGWTVRDDVCTMAGGLPTFTVSLSTVDGKVLRIVADIATVAK